MTKHLYDDRIEAVEQRLRADAAEAEVRRLRAICASFDDRARREAARG